MEEEKKQIIKLLTSSLISHVIDSTPPDVISKSSAKSEEFRLAGNSMFKSKNHSAKLHDDILYNYTLSAAFAPPSSEVLALAYGNRSSLLLHLSKFTNCIQDIDRACSITKSSALKTKLLCRKIKCLVSVGPKRDIDKTLQKAKYFYDKSESNQKEVLLKLLKEAEGCTKNQSHHYCQTDSEYTPQLKKKCNDFNSISIARNNKFGNHLVATKDIDPGEVVFIEKTFVFAVNENKNYLFCSHCFDISWSAVACDTCSRFMFCSEKCKKEAWDRYHSFDCAIVCNPNIFDIFNLMTIRTLFFGVKKAGSLKKFKNSLESSSPKDETYFQKSLENGILHSNNRFKSIFNLLDDVKDNLAIQRMNVNALGLLLYLARKSKFFGKKMNDEDCYSLVHDENVVFVGTVIIKIMNIIFTNSKVRFSHSIPYFTPDIIGNSVSIFYSLINHSCYPNVNACHAKDNKIVVYAIQPIKKNEQIFTAYPVHSDHLSNAARKFLINKTFGFTCDCIACKHEWPPLLNEEPDLMTRSVQTFQTSQEREIFHNLKEIFSKSDSDDHGKLDETMIADLAKGIKLIKQSSQSSLIFKLLVQTLIKVFDGLYSSRAIFTSKCNV